MQEEQLQAVRLGASAPLEVEKALVVPVKPPVAVDLVPPAPPVSKLLESPPPPLPATSAPAVVPTSAGTSVQAVSGTHAVAAASGDEEPHRGTDASASVGDGAASGSGSDSETEDEELEAEEEALEESSADVDFTKKFKVRPCSCGVVFRPLTPMYCVLSCAAVAIPC